MYICIYVYMYICIYVYMYICIYVYMCICIYVYMCICVYVYMCIHICNRSWVDPKLVDTGQDADRSPGWTSDFSNVGPAARATAADSEPWLGQSETCYGNDWGYIVF